MEIDKHTHSDRQQTTLKPLSTFLGFCKTYFTIYGINKGPKLVDSTMNGCLPGNSGIHLCHTSQKMWTIRKVV